MKTKVYVKVKKGHARLLSLQRGKKLTIVKGSGIARKLFARSRIGLDGEGGGGGRMENISVWGKGCAKQEHGEKVKERGKGMFIVGKQFFWQGQSCVASPIREERT